MPGEGALLALVFQHKQFNTSFLFLQEKKAWRGPVPKAAV
jgi:hypothetical protein